MDIFEEVLTHLFQHLSDKLQESKKKNRISDEFHRLMSIIEIFYPYAVGIRFKGSVYCIIIDIVNKDKNSSLTNEDFSKYIAICNTNNFIPVQFKVYPTALDPYSFENVHEGSNLLNLLTGKFVDIYADSVRELIPRSNYEYLDAAIQCLSERYGKSLFNNRISTLDLFDDPFAPVRFRDKEGKLNWVFVKYHFRGKKEIDNRHHAILPKFNPQLAGIPGYLADIEFEEKVSRVYSTKAKLLEISKIYSPE